MCFPRITLWNSNFAQVEKVRYGSLKTTPMLAQSGDLGFPAGIQLANPG